MIETRGLTRHFRANGTTVEAVRGIDVHVAAGELVAFLGPNGAGKSTTLRMLTTLLQPTAGTATVVGCDVVDDPAGVRRRIGYIGQGNSAAHVQQVRDEVVAQGRAYGIGRRRAAARADEVLAALGLDDLAGRLVSSLSGGQRRRLDVALGMVHRPALLFLDEPSTGLDPQNRANLQDEVRRLRDEHGTTLVLTTHYLDEADALADRVVVIDHGRIIADDTPERLKSELAGDRMALTAASAADAGAVAAAVDRTGAAQHVEVRGATVTGRVRGGAGLLPSLLRDIDGAGVALAAAEVARPTLDDVFLALTGRSLRDGGEAVEPDAAGAPPGPAHDPATATAADTDPATVLTMERAS